MLSINDAKEIAYKHRKAGVIVIYLEEDGKIGSASYGMTRKLCDAMKSVSNKIMDRIQSGDIEPD